MINCSECLNNLGNGNLELLRLGLSQWLEEQELDPDCTMELLQQCICSQCQGAEA